ncbi:hypothetical protein ONO97_19345, partial [Salmonella enterica subsp. enterica serovar Anatum]|nr:hypothetical protein [Salmonella enterica subsp. enterica serovar Anatum]
GTKGDNLPNANKPTFILGNIDADARYVTVEVQYGGTKEVLTAGRKSLLLMRRLILSWPRSLPAG